MSGFRAGLFAAGLCSLSNAAMADTLPLRADSDLIGEVGKTEATHEDTLLDVARHNGLGYTEIKLVNTGVDTWLPGAGQSIALPKRYILPETPQEGVVLNIPEMRLYYYPRAKDNETPVVMTYPLGIGREGWGTPYATTRVTAKVAHPAWYPPESIRQEHAEAGDPLPKVVPAGPDNPLGDYALRLDLPSYLIHGTNKPWGVGMRVSHGCIRLYPEHIEELFQQVEVGTAVRIINQPYKVGLHNGLVYLEAHPYLEEDSEQFTDNFNHVVELLSKRTEAAGNFEIDWELVRQVMDESAGMPVAVGMQLSDPAQPVTEDDGDTPAVTQVRAEVMPIQSAD